jgi:hypothetical protein
MRAMGNSSTPLTEIYSQWLQTVRSFIPGAGPGQPVVEKKAEVIAKQEWEDEGGSPRVVPPAKTKGAPKLLSRKVAAKAPSKPKKSKPKSKARAGKKKK